MFNKDFYPTPESVIVDHLLDGLDIHGKKVYDPSSGKGDILQICRAMGADTYGSEIVPELYKASSLHGKMIGEDFLNMTTTDVISMDYIIMNPPFSKDIEHILHAWKIAPKGCVIRALCNFDTLTRDIRKSRVLVQLITDNGGSITPLGKCFTHAERTTNVNVAMISVSKEEGEKENWDDYFSRENIQEEHAPGLMTANAIDEVVGRYVGSLRMYDEVMKTNAKISEMMGPINIGTISFGCFEKIAHNRMEHLSYENFKKSLQKSAWNTVFAKMNMEKFMTQNLRDKIARFVDEQSETPFTVENIYNMLRFVQGTHTNRMKEVLIEVFDSFTKHYHDNRYQVEGWKTNSHYMINEKIIIPYMVHSNHDGGWRFNFNGSASKIDDFTKALCYITGQPYDEIGRVELWCSNTKIHDPEYYRTNEKFCKAVYNEWKYYSDQWDTKEKFTARWPEYEPYLEKEIKEAARKGSHDVSREYGKWYEWGFFELKAFKKGTLHMKFKDKKVWEMFNRAVAEIKGLVVPEAI